ncbi:hypothetical protein BS50DRAFT_594787 [Corynespora cassiicola Philippines]|uniref:Uncharacterized protein n=1 Tax=Corynespora cassiicola Philippines TaxID=1448308 RepID=A0A2T2N0Z1_CORCC|nr:hypothetical protein BS50DRAFT_594923 [Corynespora cassiicola Philippines]PSN59297.1 hypothetical protein BS50DRAFT_594787 [Corynespora cassiicola Philippines]
MCKFTRVDYACGHASLLTTYNHTQPCRSAHIFGLHRSLAAPPASCHPLQTDIDNPAMIATQYEDFGPCTQCNEYTSSDAIFLDNVIKDLRAYWKKGQRLAQRLITDRALRVNVGFVRDPWLRAFLSDFGENKINALYADELDIAEEILGLLQRWGEMGLSPDSFRAGIMGFRKPFRYVAQKLVAFENVLDFLQDLVSEDDDQRSIFNPTYCLRRHCHWDPPKELTNEVSYCESDDEY